jgi:hypothetical protein
MKNSKIGLLTILGSITMLFVLNSFKEKPKQGCSPNYIKSVTIKVNARRANLRGALPGYEQCVRSFQNNNSREEFITNAYSVLGEYYLSINNINNARLYRRLVAQENQK